MMFRKFILNRAFTSSNKHSTEFIKKFKQGNYYGVLGIENPSINDEDVKFKYYGILKKYHTDYAQNLPKQLQQEYDEITKYANRSFEAIMYERNKNRVKNKPQFFEKENEISMAIFGRPFSEMKYKMYQDQYAGKRAKFFEEIRRVRGYPQQQSKQYDYFRYRDNATKPAPQNIIQQQDSYYPYIAGSIVVIIGTGILYSIYQQRESKSDVLTKTYQQPKKYELHEIKQLELNTAQLKIDRDQKIIDSLDRQRPKNMLMYPNQEDPPLIEQLVEYSIGQDVHLYEVEPEIFETQQKFRQIEQKFLKQQKSQSSYPYSFFVFKLDKIKPNTVLSLSLQAERCLQNVHVKVKDIIDEVQQTGSYKPPVILFKFHGYIMLEIRPKPFSLKNYKNTEYISLFDLYFDYYSPIFFKRNQYYHYLVGLGDNQDSNFGLVNFNRRPVKQVLISQKNKNFILSKSGHKVVNVTNQAKKVSSDQFIWKNYYRTFYDRLSSDNRAKEKARSTVSNYQR